MLQFLTLLLLPLTTLGAGDDLIFTLKQKQRLDEFKVRVEPRITEDFMKSELYLANVLKRSGFNVDNAERNLLDNIRWRKENKISKIMELDFSDFIEDYPYTTDEVFDKEGRPTLSFNSGEWDIRKAAVTGKSSRLILYFAKLFEEMRIKIEELQKEGKPVSRFNLLLDVRDHNLVQNCPQCIQIYIGLIKLLSSRYPGLVHRCYLVNAPVVLQSLMTILKASISSETFDVVKIYGPNKTVWKKELLKYFDKLPPQFGGLTKS